MSSRHPKYFDELQDGDLDQVPAIVLIALIQLFDILEVYRPLTPEEMSTREMVVTVRYRRNALVEERFGRGQHGVRSGESPF